MEEINVFSLREAVLEHPSYQVERQAKETKAQSVVKCSQCGKYFSRKSFSRHRWYCSKESLAAALNIFTTSVLVLELSNIKEYPEDPKNMSWVSWEVIALVSYIVGIISLSNWTISFVAKKEKRQEGRGRFCSKF